MPCTCSENASWTSLEIDPEYVGALYNLGLAYFNNKQFENAVNFLEKTIEIQPQNQRAKKLLENALQKVNDQNIECRE